VAKKFSLKDNPIFQRLEAPEPREAEPPVEEALPAEEVSHASHPQGSFHEGHDLTVIDRPSAIDPQQLTLSRLPEQQAHFPVTDAQVQTIKALPSSQVLGLKDHLDKSLFFGFFNEMVDRFAPNAGPQ
jgi:hypothetical protein